jgi:hypothetical protein
MDVIYLDVDYRLHITWIYANDSGSTKFFLKKIANLQYTLQMEQ